MLINVALVYADSDSDSSSGSESEAEDVQGGSVAAKATPHSKV
jgi:hypothetical protein